MEAVTMSMTKDSADGKSFAQIWAMVNSLRELVEEAAKAGQSLYEIESALLKQVLAIGHEAVNVLLALQGLGDLGETIAPEEGKTLHRSEQPHNRTLRTVFGKHTFQQYVYSPGANRKVELRPIDARLSLSPRVCSYLLEEFSQMFCIQSAFGQSAEDLETVLGQKLSVDTLEAISRAMGADAETYADNLPVPPAEEEGEILVATMDAKGVPLVREDAAKVKAFETQKQRPGNRRMATLAGVYSVDAHVRTPEDIVAALFREEADEEADADKPARPQPKFKHLTVHFPETYGEGEETVEST
jgi:hypothetical protein